MFSIVASIWEALEQPTILFVTALLGYLTWWLKQHVGKSNAHGSLNKQAEDLNQKVSRLERELLDIKKEDQSNE